MPHFCACGANELVCQACGIVSCSNCRCENGADFEWVERFTRSDGSPGTGQVEVGCLRKISKGAGVA